MKIAPNPASAGWQIESPAGINRVEVYDMQGRLLLGMEANGASALRVDGEGLPVGVLLLKVCSADRVRYSRLLKISG